MQSRPWLPMILYILAIAMNWYYAYAVESQPAVIVNSWSVLFPLISFFYLTFCFITLTEIFLRIKGGFSLSYITIVLGAFMSAISYLQAFRLYPAVHTYFIVTLALNLLITLYLIYYSEKYPIIGND